jgi:hypothetical protein
VSTSAVVRHFTIDFNQCFPMAAPPSETNGGGASG